MAGDTDVANVAITLVGGTRITSLTDGSTNANRVNDIYAEVRDDLLRSHNWNFATKKLKLAQSATAPAFEFDYAYPVPSDWLKNVSAHNNDGAYGTIFYRTEFVGTQRCICTSADEVYLRYIYRVTDPNLMAPDFRRAFELALARDLAIPIASSNVIQEKYARAAEKKLAAARSIDAMGSFPEVRPQGSWARVRGGRRRSFLSD